MAKNPYEAYQRLQQIAEGKRRWSDADAANDDAGRKAAHDSAAGAYDWLRGNGYADMAAYMDTVGADEAARYAESKKPVTAYDPTVDARLVSEYLKPQWDAANAAGDQAGMATAAAQGQDAYARMTAGGYGDLATAIQGMGSGAAQEYTRLLGGSYAPTAEGVQKKSNDAYATGKGYGRDLIDASDRVYRDLINVNPMQTGYGRNVMRDYGAAADSMYDSTLGAGIEAAGGNADSYGAAQANRNKAAVIQQGHADIRGFYDSLTGAGNTWYANRANALNGNLTGLQANVNADWGAEAGREANDLAARQAESAAATASEQAYYDYLTALQNAETEGEKIAAEREFKAKEAALDRESKERIAEINAAAKGTTGTRSTGTRSSGTRSSGTRSSGTRSNGTRSNGTRSNGTSGSSRSDTGESLIAWAEEAPMGTIGNGRTPYANRRNEALKKGSPAEQDAEIQAVLDSNEYSPEYKKIVSDDWFAQTGRRLAPRSYRDQFRANPYVSAAITDITKLPAYQNDRGNVYNYVEDLQRAGNVNDDEARYILNYFGIKA